MSDTVQYTVTVPGSVMRLDSNTQWTMVLTVVYIVMCPVSIAHGRPLDLRIELRSQFGLDQGSIKADDEQNILENEVHFE